MMSNPQGPGEYGQEPPPVYRPDDSDQPTLNVDQPTLFQPPFLQQEQATQQTLPPAQPAAQPVVFPPDPPGVFPVSPRREPVVRHDPFPLYSAPISGTPVTGYGEPPRPTRRSKAVPVLAALSVLLFLAAAVMTGLYVTGTGESEVVRKKADSVAGKDQKISELTAAVASKNAELEKTRQQLAGSQNEGKDLEEQKKVVATCLRLTFDFLNTLSAGDEASKAKAQEILGQMRTPCNQAEPYIK
ncbi:hypothetical protein R8Z50_28295 [Longispora sp. K20-0274]|uniref:hypothetical protein n=1 Tax=Longispora sp. K20-0274 TaxID=3088255 RepID=UPI0039995A18